MLRRLGRGRVSAAIASACLVAAGCATERSSPGPEGSSRHPAGISSAAADESSTAAAAAAEPAAAEAEDADAEGAESADTLFDDGTGKDYEPPRAPRDPLEPMNRAFFSLNQHLDRWFWDPLTRAYRFVTPEALRLGVRHALQNLNSPVFFVNNVLQLRFLDAAETFGAFALNSTLGMLGFFEPSLEAGWRARPADFGQTLALVGIHSGPYVVVPVLGPTTIRDGLGSAVDRFFQPLTYILGLGTQILWGGGEGLSTREEVSDQLAELERSSVDFYATMRSVFLQNREGEIADARARRSSNLRAFVPGERAGDAEAKAAPAAPAPEQRP